MSTSELFESSAYVLRSRSQQGEVNAVESGRIDDECRRKCFGDLFRFDVRLPAAIDGRRGDLDRGDLGMQGHVENMLSRRVCRGGRSRGDPVDIIVVQGEARLR